MSDDKKQKKDEATPKDLKPGEGSHTRLGLLPPDDPVYRMGLLVAGRPLYPPRKSSAKEGGEHHGY